MFLIEITKNKNPKNLHTMSNNFWTEKKKEICTN